MKTFMIKTIGCKANQYDGQLIRESLSANGYREHDGGSGIPDLCIINTCAVTHAGVAKSRRAVKRAVRTFPDARVIVTGCCVESEPGTFSAIKGVTRLVGNKHKEHIIDVLGEERKSGARIISGFAGHSRAFIKIQDGCDFSCAYCIVPSVRGRSRSRQAGEILREARQVAAHGYREIVLAGIHLGMYGRDRKEPSALPELILKLERIEGIGRIRLSSIEPGEVTDKLVEIMASGGKLCRHLHIPLQSGDKKVLQAMNRNYTPAYYRELVDRIRSRMPEVSLTTDIMVGFPGEDDGAFSNTVAMVRHCGFSRVHLFPFSPRPGTAAWFMGDPVPSSVKSARRRFLEEAAGQTAHLYRKSFVGKTVKVIIQGRCKKGPDLYYGLTGEYLRAHIRGGDFKTGELYEAYIEADEGGVLKGSPQFACV